MKWFLEILCYEQPRNWFIWHSSRESRLHCGPKNVCLNDVRKVCLNYMICKYNVPRLAFLTEDNFSHFVYLEVLHHLISHLTFLGGSSRQCGYCWVQWSHYVIIHSQKVSSRCRGSWPFSSWPRPGQTFDQTILRWSPKKKHSQPSKRQFCHSFSR